MTPGSICFRASLAGLLIVSGLLGWIWWHQPRTPEALFQVRCSSCHELRRERLCEFAAPLRPAIVGVMRREHGADEVISDSEAEIIETFLRDQFECP